jgi:hypothetical protein
LIFLRKFLVVRFGWLVVVLPLYGWCPLFADIDQADLLGGVRGLLGYLAEKIIFCNCIFSDFHGFSLAIFS